MKKILISLLCVMMVACMMPVMAFAEDEPGATSTAAEIIDLGNDGARTLADSCFTKPIKVEGTGELHLKNLTIETAGDALTVAGNGITLIIEDSVSIISTDGSAITGEVIDISGTGTLKAIAGDANGAFGIG
ncbi:MAG: hypothetical protein II354_01990, partial [Firmicutes bacterium]|nr:hypothetical protein [Bacillota bacterium]